MNLSIQVNILRNKIRAKILRQRIYSVLISESMNEFHYDLFLQDHEINRFRFIFQNLRQHDLHHKYARFITACDFVKQ